MRNAINRLGSEAVLHQTIALSQQLNLPDKLHIGLVCQTCCKAPELAPDFSANNKVMSDEQRIERWVRKFLHGYEERISHRCSKMPRVIPDQAVSIIIQAGLSKLPLEEANKIVYAHRLGMSAENILGLLLEEFLFDQLSPLGWALAWGETVAHVDFCAPDGSLLQIKNRSNSENSSSRKIRTGTEIKKWHRINATNGRCEWEKLCDIAGVSASTLNEKVFQQFIRKTLAGNPKALAVEPENPWGTFKN